MDFLLILASGIFASLGSRNVYKNMLNNMVSLITCVSMNHQNQLEQMANEVMFATITCPPAKSSTDPHAEVSRAKGSASMRGCMNLHQGDGGQN
jgi:hypothetical protein